MALIRPELSAAIWRWREVIVAVGFAIFGFWLIWLGGYLLIPLGAIIAALGAASALMAWRRLRFAQAVHAPGLVEIVEGQIGYLGPNFGGYVGLPDLTEVRMITIQGRRLWRLKQNDGQALLIPVDAKGADRLFDAFASLPGMDMGALVAALEPEPAQSGNLLSHAAPTIIIWRRKGRGITANG